MFTFFYQVFIAIYEPAQVINLLVIPKYSEEVSEAHSLVKQKCFCACTNVLNENKTAGYLAY